MRPLARVLPATCSSTFSARSVTATILSPWSRNTPQTVKPTMGEWRLLFGLWLCATHQWGMGPTPSTYTRLRSDQSARICLACSVERLPRRLLRKVALLKLTNCGMSTASPRTTPDTQMLGQSLCGLRRRDHRTPDQVGKNAI